MRNMKLACVVKCWWFLAFCEHYSRNPDGMLFLLYNYVSLIVIVTSAIKSAKPMNWFIGFFYVMKAQHAVDSHVCFRWCWLKRASMGITLQIYLMYYFCPSSPFLRFFFSCFSFQLSIANWTAVLVLMLYFVAKYTDNKSWCTCTLCIRSGHTSGLLSLWEILMFIGRPYKEILMFSFQCTKAKHVGKRTNKWDFFPGFAMNAKIWKRKLKNTKAHQSTLMYSLFVSRS